MGRRDETACGPARPGCAGRFTVSKSPAASSETQTFLNKFHLAVIKIDPSVGYLGKFSGNDTMNAIKTARRLLKADPTSASSRILANLVLALESEGEASTFALSSLYELDLKTFELAVEILQDWRLERYVDKKAKLFNLSQQVRAASVPDAVATVLGQGAVGEAD
jgi:hypothetical protein